MNKFFISAILVIIFTQPFLFRFADYEARENDSRLYTYFVKQLSERPLVEMVALEWRNSSPFADPNNPYVRDHLIGQFIPSVILTKLGWDYKYAHYIVNQIYRLFIPYLMFLFALSYMKKEEAIWVLLAGHVNVIALNYGLRANQEQAMLFWFLLSLYGFSILETGKGKVFLYLGSIMAFLVKGVVSLIHYPFWVMWILIFSKNKKRDFIQMCMLGVALIAVIGLYELWFSQVTGFSFWKAYYEINFLDRKESGGYPFKALLYYLPRSIGYAAPWSLGLFLFFKKDFWQKRRDFALLPLFLSFGLMLFLGSFSRHASRYIFFVYYLFAMIGISNLALFPRAKDLGKKLQPIFMHLALYFAIFFIQYGTFLIKGKTFK
ncbi:MAG: hypothetical protein NXH75_15445 [Halobacteriovoraceae bacterium]|nr:hypothetical protein [Halobacteriovoraceae bacterium]